MRRKLRDRLERLTEAQAAAKIAADEGLRVQKAAQAEAWRDVTDTEALQALRQALDGVTPDVIEAEIDGWFPRGTYVKDRAYRLLVGLRDGTVPPIAPNRREQFDRELALGRLPIPEAFARLAESAPVLRDYEREALARPAPKPSTFARRIEREHMSAHILESDMERMLAVRYLMSCAAYGRVPDTPLWTQKPQVSFHGSLSFGSASGSHTN